ncbi:MAG: diacylglycerol kinase [Clostridia bacterium]|jgi:diacylglycerol kinase (ATP)
MKDRRLIDSFNDAIEGLIHSFVSEKNMRFHFIIAIGTLVLGILAKVGKTETILLFITITLVIGMEMINTAIEAVVDMITPKYHPLAKIAKNVAAGAVLLSAINAIAVGYLVFFNKIANFPLQVTRYIRHLPVHLTFANLGVVLLVVIIVKAMNRRGSFLRGGLPSGHSALAFSLFTSITLLTKDALISTLCAIMAIMVAQSRLESKIHSLYEVVVGGVIGILVTVLIFQLILPLI